MEEWAFRRFKLRLAAPKPAVDGTAMGTQAYVMRRAAQIFGRVFERIIAACTIVCMLFSIRVAPAGPESELYA